jgi:protein-S-isoprenylcysteine O-methyltransferase Ste14
VHLTSFVLSSCWAIFFLYWFVSSFNVKKTVKVRLGVDHIGAYILVGFLIYLGLRFLGVFHGGGSVCHVDWRGCHFDLFRNVAYRPVWAQVVSSVCGVGGVIIAITARRTLGRNWSGAVVLKKDHELITRGIYAYMRHPIYTGVILMMFGIVFYLNQSLVYILMLVLLVFLWYKMFQEEKLMMETFPKDYTAYKKRTKALIPYVL